MKDGARRRVLEHLARHFPNDPRAHNFPVLVEALHAARATAREAEVAVLLLHGWTNRKIGVELNMGIVTVGVHLGRVFGKMQVQRRGELVARFATILATPPPRRT